MATHTRRRLLKTVGGVAVVGSLAGCADTGGDGNETEEPADGEPADEEPADGNETEEPADEEPAEEDVAGVRVAHLSPDAPNVDVYVDGEPAFEDVAFRDVSEYAELPPATYDVQITAAGDEEEVVFEDSIEVSAADYTIAAIGEIGEENQPFAVEVFEDDLSDPGENARIRGIHAAPDAPAVTVTDADTGSALFEDLAFGEDQTGEAPPNEYTLEVRPADAEADSEPVASFDVPVEAGTVYTAFAVGYLEPDDAPADEPFDLEIVEDSTGTDAGGADGNESDNETA
ncbi:DUF4397 domain-containing protein [Halohasta salina]|uniref:DUF4397 domain-containing protein n=1 Tax=Halohasta salina TaxID=2961621 RepID=UPI0020A415FA|nr:DUF4397 domain-containing protein [Halohasta salina]